MSVSDKISEFFDFVEEQNCKGVIVSPYTAMKWFCEHDLAHFYICHCRKIEKILTMQPFKTRMK